MLQVVHCAISGDLRWLRSHVIVTRGRVAHRCTGRTRNRTILSRVAFHLRRRWRVVIVSTFGHRLRVRVMHRHRGVVSMTRDELGGRRTGSRNTRRNIGARLMRRRFILRTWGANLDAARATRRSEERSASFWVDQLLLLLLRCGRSVLVLLLRRVVDATVAHVMMRLAVHHMRRRRYAH
jgi:hypothetical protein